MSATAMIVISLVGLLFVAWQIIQSDAINHLCDRIDALKKQNERGQLKPPPNVWSNLP